MAARDPPWAIVAAPPLASVFGRAVPYRCRGPSRQRNEVQSRDPCLNGANGKRGRKPWRHARPGRATSGCRWSRVRCGSSTRYRAARRSSFNLLHKDTHNRIQMKPHDPELGAVERDDLVKGYQYEKDQYVVFTEEDFDKVQIESSKAIVIERFVDAKDVDPMYFELPVLRRSARAVAEETFRVIQSAMREKQQSGALAGRPVEPRAPDRADVPRQGAPDDDPAHGGRGARRQGVLHRHRGRRSPSRRCSSSPRS